MELRLGRADGVYRWFDSRADPLRDEHGHITGWYGANTDIEDSKNPVLEVCASGCGLESPERVFESFFTTEPSGMGMGLAICRSIVEAHGGKLRASANPAHGTTFSFILPAPFVDHV
jgi:signal transduction histidine kinase